MGNTQEIRSEIRFMVDPLLMKMRQELFGSGVSFGTIAPSALPPTIVYTTNITNIVDTAGYIKGIKTYSGGTLVGTDQKELAFTGAGVTTAGVRTTIDIATPLAAKMSNPMTVLGDIIYGGSSGTPTRRGIGSEGQYLAVSGGLPVWVTFSGGSGNLSDPTTTSGDMLYRTSSLTRLPIGTSGNVLTSDGVLPYWRAPTGSYTDPLTTSGDIPYRTSATTRLPIGVSGYVLTSNGQLPYWAPASGTGGVSGSGMVNPMTTLGDMIYGAAAGVATRLPIGTNGQLMSVVSGIPTWSTLIGATAAGIGARVTHSTTQSMSNNTTLFLLFDTERWDTDNIHSTSSNTTRLTCNTAGKYVIGGNARVANATGRLDLRIRLNGATIIAINSATQSSTNSDFLSIETVYDLAVGDYVELGITAITGSSMFTEQAGNYTPEFYMQLIGVAGGTVKQWTSFTPTVLQPTSIPLTANTQCKYLIDGPTTYFDMYIQLGGAGTTNNEILISGLPTPLIAMPRLANLLPTIVGHGQYRDEGSAYYMFNAITYNTENTVWQIHKWDSFQSIGVSPNIAVASGDSISFMGFVRTADSGIGAAGAPVDALYITASGNSYLTNEITIPGLRANADIAGRAGAGTSREFTSGDTLPTWSPSDPAVVNIDSTVPSHLYIAPTDGTERFGTYSWSPSGDFDVRCKISVGSPASSIGSTGLLLTDSGNTNRILFLVASATDQATSPYQNSIIWVAQPYTYASSTYTQRVKSWRMTSNFAYLRITRTGSTIEWFTSGDGILWQSLGTFSFTITVAKLGFRVSDNPVNVAVDWLRTNV